MASCPMSVRGQYEVVTGRFSISNGAYEIWMPVKTQAAKNFNTETMKPPSYGTPASAGSP
jgi:hypothetical protein